MIFRLHLCAREINIVEAEEDQSNLLNNRVKNLTVNLGQDPKKAEIGRDEYASYDS